MKPVKTCSISFKFSCIWYVRLLAFEANDPLVLDDVFVSQQMFFFKKLITESVNFLYMQLLVRSMDHGLLQEPTYVLETVNRSMHSESKYTVGDREVWADSFL